MGGGAGVTPGAGVGQNLFNILRQRAGRLLPSGSPSGLPSPTMSTLQQPQTTALPQTPTLRPPAQASPPALGGFQQMSRNPFYGG